jgi:hypothetical protein
MTIVMCGRGHSPLDRAAVKRQSCLTTVNQHEGTCDVQLTTTMNISVDGVVQGCGGPDEDRRGGFERGGWTTPFLDDQTATSITRSTNAPMPSCSADGQTGPPPQDIRGE